MLERFKRSHPCPPHLPVAGVFPPQDAVDFAAREMAKGHDVKQTCNRLIYEVGLSFAYSRIHGVGSCSVPARSCTHFCCIVRPSPG